MRGDIAHSKRIVVKIGTNLLSDRSGIDSKRIEELVLDIVNLQKKGVQVLLVSSGAIGLGAKELGKKGAVKAVAMRQACASIGQPILMSHYRSAFSRHQIVCSQILITRSEMNNRKTFVNLKNSVQTLLELGVVPIFNENDAVSTAEIGTAFGDNDRMSALVASKIDAQLLIILTDIGGLYTGDPQKKNSARLVSEVEKIDATIIGYAGKAGSTFSTGGMKTKLLAAKIAANAGCATIIASGYEEQILSRLLAGQQLGTYIPAEKKLKERSRWILNSQTQGCIRIDEGAVQALRNHKSLLPSGIVHVEGFFQAGEVVMINDVAKAVPYYNSEQVAAMAGSRSKDLANGKALVIFRPEDIVFLDHDE